MAMAIDFLCFRINVLEDNNLFFPLIENWRGRSPINCNQSFKSKNDAVDFAKQAILTYYQGN